MKKIFFYGSYSKGDDLAWLVCDKLSRELKLGGDLELIKTSNAFEFMNIKQQDVIIVDVININSKDIKSRDIKSKNKDINKPIVNKPLLLEIQDLNPKNTTTAHDLDIAKVLKLVKLLNPEICVKIIGIPQDCDLERATLEVERLLKTLINSDEKKLR